MLCVFLLNSIIQFPCEKSFLCSVSICDRKVNGKSNCPITRCSNRVNELWQSTKALQSEGFHASDVPALFRHIVWQEHFNSCALNALSCIGAQKQQAICAGESAWGPSLFSSLHSWLIHYECGELCILASPKHEHVMRTVFTFTYLGGFCGRARGISFERKGNEKCGDPFVAQQWIVPSRTVWKSDWEDVVCILMWFSWSHVCVL